MICNKGTCVLSCFALLCIVVLPSTALINLAKEKNTSQSSDYDPRSVSSLAVDGCTEQEGICWNPCNDFIIYCCTHQLVNQSYAWWSVDLGQLSEIAYIFVYFRIYLSYIKYPFEVFRTQGYTIRVSNDTDSQSGRMCFQDTSFDLSNYTRIRNHSSCTNISGRYVHFTNNGVMMNHYNALLELCEVQVYGCPVSTYGNQCSQLCDSSCLGRRCDLYTGKCLACEKGSFIDATGNCKVCPQNCINCQSNISCFECSDTYYLIRNGNGNVCTRCPDYCKICEKNSGCTACNDNYYLNSQVCQPCPPHCSICIHGIGCSMCEAGFGLENNACIECEKNCLKCTTVTSCSECKPGYFVLRNMCHLCPDYCINCDSGGNCNKCEDRHYIGAHGKCIECLDTCRNCSAEGCTECKDGYHGAICNERCGSCMGVICNQMTGFCLESACEEGYHGDTCKDLVDSKIKTVVNPATYVGASVGILVIFFTVTGLLIFYKRKKAVNQNNSPIYYEENIATIKGNMYDELANVENPHHEYYNTRIF